MSEVERIEAAVAGENADIDRNAVSIRNAGISFKDFSMQDIKLEIPKGYITGITGANGAGKTTLIRMMLGLYPNMSGTINIGGFDVVKDRDKMLGITGYVSEDRKFFMEYTAVENEAIYENFYPKWDRKKYRQMLGDMKVSFNTKLGELSKGNYIRFQLAFALAAQPEILILDEPTAGLDPVFRRDFLGILQNLIADEDMTVVMSTNIAEDLKKFADYIISVDAGKCVISENIGN